MTGNDHGDDTPQDRAAGEDPRPEPDTGRWASLDGVPEDLVQARDALAAALPVTDEAEPGRLGQARARLRHVGIGLADMDRPADTDNLVVLVGVVEPVPEDDIRALLTGLLHQATTTEVALRIDVVGESHPLSHQGKHRPVIGGTDTAPTAVTYKGTLGCLATGRPNTALAGKKLVLSNNHVLADDNRLKNGHVILQPSTTDPKKVKEYTIGKLIHYLPLRFGGDAVNYADCAVAELDTSIVGEKAIYMGKLASKLPLSSSVKACKPQDIGMEVGKSGRTTGVTYGKIMGVAMTKTFMNWEGSKSIKFADLIAVAEEKGKDRFAKAGDSGSVAWAKKEGVKGKGHDPVGLVFAANDSYAETYICTMQRVLDALGIAYQFGTGKP